MPVDPKKHYDQVTDAWKDFMGDNLHFGYFDTEDMELPKASERLIDKMLELCSVSSDTKILDVGCGIGGPAFYVHERCKCSIDGISTSERGIQLANESAKSRGYGNVRFKVADGLDNGFPDGHFDIAWVMESSHLMSDKKKLAQECHRVLKPGGVMVLCDVILLTNHREMLHFFAHIAKYVHLGVTFGHANRLTSLGAYTNFMVGAGFREVTAIDVSEPTIPTLRLWKQNAIRFGDRTSANFSRKDVEFFIKGCNILDEWFREGIFGYGMLRAVK